MGPPDNVSPSELFLKLMESPRPTEVIDFPRKDLNGKPIGRVRIQVLEQDEIDGARLRAHSTMKARVESPEDLNDATVKEVTGDTVARELIAQACLTEKDYNDDPSKAPIYGRIFRSADDLKKLRPDELLVLFHAYLLNQEKHGPYERVVTNDKDLNAWIKRLGVGASEFPLLQLSLPALVHLAWLLARRAFTTSVILESQWASLPDSSKSLLAGFSLDTTFYGSRASSDTETGGDENDDDPVTTESAARLAMNLVEEPPVGDQ